MTSFQGPGTGISGTSYQFTAGYSDYAGYSGYAPTAGNANGYAPQCGYANQSAASATNIQSAQGVNGTNWAWAGQGGTPPWLWGGNVGSQYLVWGPNQMAWSAAGNVDNTPVATYSSFSQYANYATQLSVQTRNDTTWNWAGVNGNPARIWGSNDGAQTASYKTSQLYIGSVGYASNATYANICNSGPQTSAAGNYSTAAYTIAGNTYNLSGGGCAAGFTGEGNIYYGNGINSGYHISLWASNYRLAMFMGKRSVAGSSADRFVVFYSPLQTNSQYGWWNGNWGTSSDFREKDEIEDLDEDKCVTFIKSLRPRKFKWKFECPDNKYKRSGFIAQEVLSAALKGNEESFKIIVNNSGEYLENKGSLDITNVDPDLPRLGVSSMDMSTPLVKTVQRLIKEVEAMKTIVGVMKKINI